MRLCTYSPLNAKFDPFSGIKIIHFKKVAGDKAVDRTRTFDLHFCLQKKLAIMLWIEQGPLISIYVCKKVCDHAVDQNRHIKQSTHKQSQQ